MGIRGCVFRAWRVSGRQVRRLQGREKRLEAGAGQSEMGCPRTCATPWETRSHGKNLRPATSRNQCKEWAHRSRGLPRKAEAAWAGCPGRENLVELVDARAAHEDRGSAQELCENQAGAPYILAVARFRLVSRFLPQSVTCMTEGGPCQPQPK